MSAEWQEEYDDREALAALVARSGDWQNITVTVRLLRELLNLPQTHQNPPQDTQ